MTPAIGLLLAIVGLALVSFTFEWVPSDVTALGVLVLLVLTGLVPGDRAFAGFGSDTVMMILGLLILTAALLRTGVVDLAGRAILRRTGTDPDRVLLVVMVAVALLSAFISNTAATAFFLPIVVGAARRARMSPARLLMPLAFASILTSSVTLISTSTNIVVSGLMTRYGLAPIGMFEMAPVGVPIAIAGLAYLWLVGRRLIPDRAAGMELTEEFDLRPYLSEVLIQPPSPLVGKSLGESGLGSELDLTVVGLVRDDQRTLLPRPDTVLQAGDLLLVEGLREEVLKIKDAKGIDIKADVKLSDPDLQSQDTRLAEVILMPRAPLIGTTLKRFRFRERYGLQVLAIHRAGETLHNQLSRVPLRMGDVLLVQGHRARMAVLAEDSTLQFLGAVEEKRPNLRRAPVAVAIFLAVLAAAAGGLLALPVAVLLGAVLAFVTGCITPDEAYRTVEWKVVILVGSMLALGSAVEETGTAGFLSEGIVALVGDGPRSLLTAFFVLTVVLTQPMSNQAAAVVVLPVAIRTALHAGLDPRPFALMVAVAASCSYLTPLEPSCLMVYAPGRYRFMDFARVGAALTVVIYVIAVALVPVLWPVAGR